MQLTVRSKQDRRISSVVLLITTVGAVLALIATSVLDIGDASAPRNPCPGGHTETVTYTYGSDEQGDYDSAKSAAEAVANRNLKSWRSMRDEGPAAEPPSGERGPQRRVVVANNDSGEDVAVFLVGEFGNGFEVLEMHACAEQMRSS